MHDEIIAYFDWITNTLNSPIQDFFPEGSPEFVILTEFKNGWGKRETAEVLKELTAKYGGAAGTAVEKFLALHIARDWKAIGEKEAHPGTEIEDFIRVLWQPLKESGDFDFTIDRTGGRTVFCVTRCPIHELARKTGLHQWMYHLACSTDFYTTPAFCPKIGFSRTKSLIIDDEPCNHTYSYK